jgi:hypothetical protein
VPARGSFSFVFRLLACFLPLFLSMFVHGFKVEDTCFVEYREVGSMSEELLHGFLFLFSILVFWLHNLEFHNL